MIREITPQQHVESLWPAIFLVPIQGSGTYLLSILVLGQALAVRLLSQGEHATRVTLEGRELAKLKTNLASHAVIWGNEEYKAKGLWQNCSGAFRVSSLQDTYSALQQSENKKA